MKKYLALHMYQELLSDMRSELCYKVSAMASKQKNTVKKELIGVALIKD